MNKWRVYLKTFDDIGNYTDEWIEITDDVDMQSMGTIAFDLDNTEYDIGIYRHSNFKLTLRNEHGKYSDVDSPRSIFRHKRSNTQVRVTWEIAEEGPFCGIAETGEAVLSEEIDVIVGLLTDENLSMDLDQQKLSFSVLGRTAIFMKAIVPFSSLSNGDLFSDIIYTCLNQSEITDLMTVSEANINVALDQTIDDISSLENKTVQEALSELLLATNSILYVSGDAIVVSPREPTAEIQYTFYGQASALGPENIQNIKGVKNGLAKTFNYISWQGASNAASDAASIAKYGIKKKQIGLDFVTNSSKRNNVLQEIRDEFGSPRQEFELSTPINFKTIAIELLDRISIDYPTIVIEEESELPICGIAVCGEAILPKLLWSFTLNTGDHYKVIGKAIESLAGIVKLKLRAV